MLHGRSPAMPTISSLLLMSLGHELLLATGEVAGPDIPACRRANRARANEAAQWSCTTVSPSSFTATAASARSRLSVAKADGTAAASLVGSLRAAFECTGRPVGTLHADHHAGAR